MPNKPFFRKHDGWWVVQLRQGCKRWQHKLVKGSLPKGKDTQQEAYRLFSELMAEGADTLPAPNKIRMTELLAVFLESAGATVKERTFQWYKMFLVSFDEIYGTLRPQQVTPEIVDAWLKTEKGWKESRRGAIMTLKRALKWAFENRKITCNPLQFLKVPAARRRERYLKKEERKQIYEHYPDGDPFRDYLFALEQTGCRPGEISKVTGADVDFRTGVWELADHKTQGKTGGKRVIILTLAMVELTKKLMAKHPEGLVSSLTARPTVWVPSSKMRSHRSFWIVGHVNSDVHVREAAEVPDERRPFDSPVIPLPVVAQVMLLVEAAGSSRGELRGVLDKKTRLEREPPPVPSRPYLPLGAPRQ